MTISRLRAYSDALDLVVSCEKHLLNVLLQEIERLGDCPAVDKAQHGLRRAIAAVESLELSFEIADAYSWENKDEVPS
jgi:hypothetical protein